MTNRDIGKIKSLPPLCLGTWAFGGDSWWGKQEDKDSVAVLDAAINNGVNIIDTAPVYGRGRSERVIGGFLRKRSFRDKTILATKIGLSWQGSKIFHNLTKKRMLEEVDESRKRLDTDYFDLYQVHWPDPDTAIAEVASVMNKLYQKGIIKSVGVSNYSVEQMLEFKKHCPLHCLQPQYSMFFREIEKEIVPFCLKNNISIITYAPLYSGILTGKFFLDKVKIPDDTNRKLKMIELEEPRFPINKDFLTRLKTSAESYGKTLVQLVINWNYSQQGVTCAIVGTRKLDQFKDNLGSIGWGIEKDDMVLIESMLQERLEKIKALENF